jgi:hypothetical protein
MAGADGAVGACWLTTAGAAAGTDVGMTVGAAAGVGVDDAGIGAAAGFAAGVAGAWAAADGEPALAGVTSAGACGTAWAAGRSVFSVRCGASAWCGVTDTVSRDVVGAAAAGTV